MRLLPTYSLFSLRTTSISRLTRTSPSIHFPYQRHDRIRPYIQLCKRAFASLPSAKLHNTSSIGSTREASRSQITSPLNILSQTILGRRKSFPSVSHKIVGYWLIGSAASVFGIVILGGLTRLTESGLSITEWRPVTGSLPPLSDEDWEAEFQKYQSSPEFKMLNPNMDLAGFKKIYYMEWAHRLWGRVVGLTFVIPAAYFIARRKVSKSVAIKLIAIAGLIGLQGFIGWWMVKSGLKDELNAPGSHPRVSQYRLVAHLGTAFLCYSAMLWSGLLIRYENYLLDSPNYALQIAERKLRDKMKPWHKVLRGWVAVLGCLVFVTAMAGGLVAGLDAGLIYNEFPRMGTGLTPPKSELFSETYSRRDDRSDLWWRNMLENPATVQLNHRILAMTTFTVTMGLWAYTRLTGARNTKPWARAIRNTAVIVCLQVALGISTLVYLVPIPLAAAHQAGSLAVLSGVIVLGTRLYYPRPVVEALVRKVNQPTRTLHGPSPAPTNPSPPAMIDESPKIGPEFPGPKLRFVAPREPPSNVGRNPHAVPISKMHPTPLSQLKPNPFAQDPISKMRPTPSSQLKSNSFAQDMEALMMARLTAHATKTPQQDVIDARNKSFADEVAKHLRPKSPSGSPIFRRAAGPFRSRATDEVAKSTASAPAHLDDEGLEALIKEQKAGASNSTKGAAKQ